jgi:hypothetical protein
VSDLEEELCRKKEEDKNIQAKINDLKQKN